MSFLIIVVITLVVINKNSDPDNYQYGQIEHIIPFNYIEIDTELMECYKENISMNTNVKGNYADLWLKEGKNTIEITVTAEDGSNFSMVLYSLLSGTIVMQFIGDTFFTVLSQNIQYLVAALLPFIISKYKLFANLIRRNG